MTRLLLTLALSIAALAGTPAQAAWPDKPVTIVVPFPPGGSTDSLARVLTVPLQAAFGRTFIVDNRAGATGTIGAGQVKRAAPDGYTLLVSSLGPFVIAPHLIKGMPYDALKDFDLLTVAVRAPNVLVVPASSPLKTVADVIAAAKKDPGKLSYASAGNGSSNHLAGEMLKHAARIDVLHVPYKGGAPALTDLMGGRISYMLLNTIEVLPHLRSQRLRALAIGAPQRSALLSEVPTMAEAGLPGFEASVWWGLVAPARTPKEIVAKLNAETKQALANPATRTTLTEMGVVPTPGSAAEFGAFLKLEVARWSKVIKAAGIQAD